MEYLIFDALDTALVHAKKSGKDWLKVNSKPPYSTQTTGWAVPAQRATDGKYYFAPCPHTDNTGIETDEWSSDWSVNQ